MLADLHSTNGTFVNGERITECELKCGCEIRVGETLFRLEQLGDDGQSTTKAVVK